MCIERLTGLKKGDQVFSLKCNDKDEQKWIYSKEEKTIKIRKENKCLDLYNKDDIFNPIMGTSNCNSKDILKWEYNEEEKTFVSNGKCLSTRAEPEQTEVWAGNLSDGNKVILLLNRASFAAEVEIKWTELGLNTTKVYLRDLWKKQFLGGFENSYKVNLASHASQLLKVFEEDPEAPTDSDSDTDSGKEESESKVLILSLSIVSLVLLLAFIGFIIFYLIQKKKKSEQKEPSSIDTDSLDNNLIRESKNSTGV